MVFSKKKALGILAAVIICAALISSCTLTHPAAGTRNVFPADPVDPALVRGTLDNGFCYLILKNTTPEERVSVHLNVFTGSVAETKKERGMAHFLEHMVFNGSEHFKPGELVTYFQSIGMDFGGDANARTSFFTTVYDLNLPKGDEDYLKKAFVVLRDYAGGALLLDSEIDRERGVILSEKRERDSVSYRTFKKELAFELPGSVLARRMPIGTEPVINAIDRKAMKAFYDRWYRPDNMALVVVGDMDVKLTESLIKERFGSLAPRGAVPDALPVISWAPHKGQKYFYHREPEAGATRVTIERLVRQEFESERVSDLKEETLEYLGDQIFQNRLSRMVREQTADFTSATVYSGSYLRHLEIAVLQATCDPENWESVLAQLDQTLRQALAFGFSQGELDRVKADAITSLEAQVAKADTRKSPGIARELLSSLNSRSLFLSPKQERDLLMPFIQDVSLADVNKAFRALWPDDHRLVLATGNLNIDNAGTGNTPEDRIADVFTASRTVVPAPYVQVKAKAFPYLTLPDEKAGVAGEKKNVNGLGIDQVDFKNNIRINLKQTEFKKGDFSFKVVFGNGRAGMPDKLYGLSSLVQACVEESGLGHLDADELDNAMAGRDVSIGFKINDTSFSLEGRAAPGEAELVLQLIYTYLMDPGFRPQSLALAKSHYRQQFASISRTTDGAMQIKGSRFLAGGDLRFGIADPSRAENISMTQIESWIRPAFETGPLEVSFAGDFDITQVKTLAGEYLGSLPFRRPTLKKDNRDKGQIHFPKGETQTFYVDSRLNKAVARVSFLTDDFWDITQTRQLSLLSRVLSERLRESIRENLGASYSPYVYNTPSLIFDGYGIMNAVVNLSPDQMNAVIQQIEVLVRRLVEDGIQEKELALVKGPLMNHLKVLRQTNSYWLNSVMADSFRHPERLTWAVNLVTGYGEITAETLNKLANRYLVTGSQAIIKVLPGKAD